jgi:hypothetical protein
MEAPARDLSGQELRTGGFGATILVSQSPVPPDAMYIGAMGSLVNFKTGLQAWIHVRA